MSGTGVAPLVSMNLSKQGLTANSKVQVRVDDDREVKAVWAHSTGPITILKRTFHVLTIL